MMAPWLFPVGPFAGPGTCGSLSACLSSSSAHPVSPPRVQHRRPSVLCRVPLAWATARPLGTCHVAFPSPCSLRARHTTVPCSSDTPGTVPPRGPRMSPAALQCDSCPHLLRATEPCPAASREMTAPAHSHPRVPAPAFLCSMTAVTVGPQALVPAGMPAV